MTSAGYTLDEIIHVMLSSTRIILVAYKHSIISLTRSGTHEWTRVVTDALAVKPYKLTAILYNDKVFFPYTNISNYAVLAAISSTGTLLWSKVLNYANARAWGVYRNPSKTRMYIAYTSGLGSTNAISKYRID